MAGNEECAVIEVARPNLANMTQAIVKPNIIGHFELKQYMADTISLFTVGEAKEWLQKEPVNSIHTWDDLAYKLLIKFFPTKKTKLLRSQILGFQQRDGETLCQAWKRYKKLLRDCQHHCQTDEVLGHTFVDGLDEASKMNLDSACGGNCMARPYSEIQLLLNNFTANDHNWQGDGDSRRAIKQKADVLIELDDFSAMRANIAKLSYSNMCPTNPESICYVGQQRRGPMNQHAQYGNTYNPNWKNHPNFSWGKNQLNQNHYRPQGNFNQPQNPPQQIEESTNDLLKKLLLDNQQLRTDFRNLERQIGQLASNQNTRPASALPNDTEKNPKFNAVTLRNGRELEEVSKKRKDKHIPEGELIPKATFESKKNDATSEPAEAARLPPPFPQRLQKKNDDRMFNKFLSMLIQVQLNIPLVDVLREIPNFTIPVRIGNIDLGRALCDLGARISLPLSLFKQLGLGARRPTTVMLQLVDRSIAYLEGVIEDVLLQIGKFIFPADFIILDYEADELVPIILG
ncbi:uncharacterized protein [Nicotiana sylvestris]|uniref:uncharacterized protein n=1 Tax=Nicotiana sylvestris TaxID=4096 RepID=UPI00388C5A26